MDRLGGQDKARTERGRRRGGCNVRGEAKVHVERRRDVRKRCTVRKVAAKAFAKTKGPSHKNTITTATAPLQARHGQAQPTRQGEEQGQRQGQEHVLSYGAPETTGALMLIGGWVSSYAASMATAIWAPVTSSYAAPMATAPRRP